MARKREERGGRGGAQRGARGKSRNSTNGQDNTIFHSLKQQLVAMGLMLKEIPGDGNCLFRALGDQLDGCPNYHAKHRQDVVAYMREHRDDFEPFVEDDVPFERHLSNLAELGTYGGNECIVAFARLHSMTVVIHQLNTPLWTICGIEGSQKTQKELHVSYHNGDHYNSVRKCGGPTNAPSNIKLAVAEKEDKKPKNTEKCIRVNGGYSHGYDKDYSSWADNDVDYSEPVYEGLSKEEQLVMDQTGCSDLQLIRLNLEACDYDVHEATDNIFSTIAQEYSRGRGEYPSSSNSGLWGPAGTGTRVVGDSAAAAVNHSSIHPAIQPSIHPSYQKKQIHQEKLQQRLKLSQHISNSKRKEIKKQLRKQQASERKRQESNGIEVVDDDYGSDSTTDHLSIVRDIGCLSI